MKLKCSLFLFLVICADGHYYKFVYNSKGECNLDVCLQFLEMADEVDKVPTQRKPSKS